MPTGEKYLVDGEEVIKAHANWRTCELLSNTKFEFDLLCVYLGEFLSLAES
jgi:hypothetical protein